MDQEEYQALTPGYVRAHGTPRYEFENELRDGIDDMLESAAAFLEREDHPVNELMGSFVLRAAPGGCLWICFVVDWRRPGPEEIQWLRPCVHIPAK